MTRNFKIAIKKKTTGRFDTEKNTEQEDNQRLAKHGRIENFFAGRIVSGTLMVLLRKIAS